MAADDLACLERYLEPVTLKVRQKLESANRKVSNAYFIERGIASVVAIGCVDRRQGEVGIVGREGMTGLPIVFGLERSPHDTLMQLEGEAQCIAADNLRLAMTQSASLRSYLLRYAYVFAVQAGHAALANAQGSVEERLARWLLMAHDRIDGTELVLTHEFLGLVLGVRRASVTTALHKFQDQGLIVASRGNVTVLDRAGLEESANGLYGVPEMEFERLFQS